MCDTAAKQLEAIVTSREPFGPRNLEQTRALLLVLLAASMPTPRPEVLVSAVWSNDGDIPTVFRSFQHDSATLHVRVLFVHHYLSQIVSKFNVPTAHICVFRDKVTYSGRGYGWASMCLGGGDVQALIRVRLECFVCTCVCSASYVRYSCSLCCRAHSRTP